MYRHAAAALLALMTPASAHAAACANLPVEKNVRALGWDMAALTRARDHARAGGSAAFMVVTRGKVVMADGDIAKPLWIASVRKSILSAMFGQLVEEGQVKLADPVSKYGIGDDTPLTAQEKSATIGDLITARSGVYVPTAAETVAMKAQRPARGSHAPGTFWYYNNWDFNVLGDIYERVTSKPVFAAFDRRIVRPLCMQDFDLYENASYQFDPTAPRFPAYHMALSARDLMRFGMLYLDKGRWNGTQVVPAAWVAESTRALTPTDRRDAIGAGYGYLWWITTDARAQEGPEPKIPLGSFTASGSGGQEMTVIPALDTVILTRADHLNGKPSTFASFGEWQKLVRLTLAARIDKDQ